jgi:uncharacterized protein DUF2865
LEPEPGVSAAVLSNVMNHRSLLALTVALTGLLALGETAHAQSAFCQRYRAELASLGSGGSRAAGAAQQQRAEIARLSGYYHSIGCSQPGFFGPPPECGPIASRIQAMQANLGRLAGQSDDTGARRRHLIAAIQQACQPQREARLEVKPPRAAAETSADEKPRRAIGERRDRDEDEARPRRGLGGGRLVCVRACDGFFFPLTNAPEGRADAMCQALCPGAQTAAYSMPSGEAAELDRAVSLKGKPYARLASAFKFQKGVDPSCSCKKEGQTWAQALARAEVMLKRRPGDIIVTAQKAEELSRPKIALAARRGRDKSRQPDKPFDVETTGSVRPPGQATPAQAAAAKASEPVEAPKPETTSLVPTASRASSGIGPKSIEGVKVIARTEGPRREVTDDQGVKRTVRIVAPNVIPVPAQVQAGAP